MMRARPNVYAQPGPVSLDELSQRLRVAERVLGQSDPHGPHFKLICRTIRRDCPPLTFNGVKKS
jgi:hypothetical protein